MAYRIVLYNEKCEAFYGQKEYKYRIDAEQDLEESLQEESYIDGSLVTGGEVQKI